MNILYLTGCLSMGGTEIYTLNMAQAFREKGDAVYWATVKEGELKETVESQGIELLYCNLGRRTPGALLESVQQIRKIYQEKKIDIIHSADAYSAMISTLAFRNRKHRPHLIWSNVGIGAKSYALMRKFCGKSFDLIIAVSNHIRNRMIEEGFEPERIRCHIGSREMLLPTVERSELRRKFEILDGDIVIGTVGRVVPMKGNRTVILAMPQILKEVPNAKLVIVGDGTERKELEQLVYEIRLEEHVLFLGFQDHIENMYNLFDVVAFPTYWEALGYIPIEAMFYEKPLVASWTGGVPEIVRDTYNGLLVPPAIPDLWAQALVRIIKDTSLQQKMVRNGKMYYNQYLTEEISSNKLEQLYIEVLSNENGTSNIHHK